MARLMGVPVVALTLVRAGCGGGAGTTAGAGPKIGAIDIGAAPPDTLRDGGTFRWTLDGFPPNFNYNQLDGTYVPTNDVLGGLMPNLFISNADGTVRSNPDYLKSVQLTNTNPETITYTLQDKATWSDGTPITWQDLDAQWRALNGTDPAYQISSSTGYSNIASVQRGTSDKQAVVTFATPFADWKSLFSPLYPASTNNDATTFNSGWTKHPLVTAGPFKVEAVDPTAKTVTVVRDEKWWGKKPRLDRIIYRDIPTVAQFDALANNETDFVDIGPDVNSYTRAQSTPGVTIRKALAPNYRHITFNGRPGSLLSDPKLRIAIQKAIDAKAIAQAQIGRVVPDPAPLGNHIYVQGQKGYTDNSGIVSYDPAAAAQQLDKLGWVQQGQVRHKDGKELILRDTIPAQTPVADQESRQVQQFLARVGVKLVIDAVPTDDFFSKYINQGNFDITHFSWIGTVFPVSSKGSIYGTRGDTQQNFGGIGNDTINKLFDEANRELNPQREIQLANQIDQEIWKSGHSLLLYQRPNVIAVRNNVANFGAFGFADKDFTAIGFKK
jgi:peptide/nickel transport system substrate-binding protein